MQGRTERVGEAEALRHDADHGVRRAIQPESRADHAVIAGETGLPQVVGDEHHALRTRQRIVRHEIPAQQWCDAQQAERVGRDPRAASALGRADHAADIVAQPLMRSHALQRRLTLLQRGKPLAAHVQRAARHACVRPVDVHEPLRLRHGQVPQHGVGDGDHRRRRGDAQADGGDGAEVQERRAEQGAQGHAKRVRHGYSSSRSGDHCTPSGSSMKSRTYGS